MPFSVSAIVITYNEARQIRDCLATLAWCDEVVVVDSGSTDGTIEIARSRGARVIVTKDWPGFGPQKQRALDAAKGDWIVSLDADERLTPSSIAEIREAIESDEVDGLRLPRLSWFLTRFVHHSGWWPDEVLRVARRDRARFTDHVIHERLEVEGSVRTLRDPIEHLSYRDRATVLRKIDDYSDAGAQELARQGKPGGRWPALKHGSWAFIRTWLVRRGFLDGRAGWGIAAMNAKTSYLKYLKRAKLPD